MMQPFQFDQSSLVQSTRKPVQGLPAGLKAILMLKTLSCLLIVGASLLMMISVSDPANWTQGFSAEYARRVALLSMVATGISLLELLGVAGTWSFKRWGVYVLSGFSMLNFVVLMQSHQTFSAGTAVVSTMVVGFVIASRWKDFE